MEYERELVIRTAGALPVVAKLAERLGVVEAVDRFCPIRSVADYTHGQVVLALVANRLTHPRPLSSFQEWGEEFAVAETLGIASCKLNDDRLGRALDALAEHLPEVLSLIGRRAIERLLRRQPAGRDFGRACAHPPRRCSRSVAAERAAACGR